ncbi:MAG: hypothetical protein AB8B73_14230 [Ekhidna sp.]
MEKKKDLKVSKKESEEKTKKEEEDVKSSGLPEDIDFKKFLGCGG